MQQQNMKKAIRDLQSAQRHLEVAVRRLSKALDTPQPPKELRMSRTIRHDPGLENEARLSNSLDEWRFLACELMREAGMSLEQQLERMKQNGVM